MICEMESEESLLSQNIIHWTNHSPGVTNSASPCQKRNVNTYSPHVIQDRVSKVLKLVTEVDMTDEEGSKVAHVLTMRRRESVTIAVVT